MYCLCNFHCIFYMCFFYFAAYWRNKRLIDWLIDWLIDYSYFQRCTALDQLHHHHVIVNSSSIIIIIIIIHSHTRPKLQHMHTQKVRQHVRTGLQRHCVTLKQANFKKIVMHPPYGAQLTSAIRSPNRIRTSIGGSLKEHPRWNSIFQYTPYCM